MAATGCPPPRLSCRAASMARWMRFSDTGAACRALREQAHPQLLDHPADVGTPGRRAAPAAARRSQASYSCSTACTWPSARRSRSGPVQRVQPALHRPQIARHVEQPARPVAVTNPGWTRPDSCARTSSQRPAARRGAACPRAAARRRARGSARRHRALRPRTPCPAARRARRHAAAAKPPRRAAARRASATMSSSAARHAVVQQRRDAAVRVVAERQLGRVVEPLDHAVRAATAP